MKEIPSRHVQENLPEKASIHAFTHLKLMGNLQGFCQYILADMLNLTIVNSFYSPKIAQTLSHVLEMNLLDKYFCPKNSPTKKIKEF